MIPTTLVHAEGKGLQDRVGRRGEGRRQAGGRHQGDGPGGKDFKLYFDKESGLPVKTGGEGRSASAATNSLRRRRYDDYKDFDGIKKATKIEAKRDGEKFVDVEITEFKVLDKVPPKTFTEPQ